MKQIINSHKFKRKISLFEILNIIVIAIGVIGLSLVFFTDTNEIFITILVIIQFLTFSFVLYMGFVRNYKPKCSKCGLDKDDTIHKYIIPKI